MGASGFGERVAQARREMSARLRRDVRQMDVARALGVTHTAVSRWESGDKVPDVNTIERLAAFYGLRAGYLAFGELPEREDTPPVTPPAPPAQDHRPVQTTPASMYRRLSNDPEPKKRRA